MRTPLLAFIAALLAAGPAAAHIQLISPVQRHSEQKLGPCGIGPNDMRGPNVTEYAPGEQILVSWTEDVEHPGHFRISFDADGFDDFVDPASYDDFYSNAAVLVDEIADKNGGLYEQMVTLPDIQCDNCTLQVIQVMTDKPPYQIGTNDLYYQCADIRLVGEPMGTSTGPDTTDTTDTGDDTTSTGGESTEGNTVTTDISGCGVVQTVGCSSFSDSDPFTTGGPGELPTGTGGTGAVDTSTTADEPTGTTSAPATTTAATSTTDPMNTDDDDKGCGCRGDVGGAGWLALLVVPFVRRRRDA